MEMCQKRLRINKVLKMTNITKTDLKLILLAIDTAIRSELELRACYTRCDKPIEGSEDVFKQIAKLITRYEKLQKKLQT
jgi:hypothetical protein